MGVALLQGSLSLSPIPPDDEWEQFARSLADATYRLPTTTKPRHYEVTLTPYFETFPQGGKAFSFDGEVTIYTSATEADVTEIVMHCNDLTIDTVEVQFTDATNIPKSIVTPNQQFVCEMPYTFLRIATTEPLRLGQEYQVRITFRGNLQTNMNGFYRSWYIDSTGQKR